MNVVAELELPTQEIIQSDLCAVFRGAVKLALETALDAAVLVGHALVEAFPKMESPATPEESRGRLQVGETGFEPATPWSRTIYSLSP